MGSTHSVFVAENLRDTANLTKQAAVEKSEGVLRHLRFSGFGATGDEDDKGGGGGSSNLSGPALDDDDGAATSRSGASDDSGDHVRVRLPFQGVSHVRVCS